MWQPERQATYTDYFSVDFLQVGQGTGGCGTGTVLAGSLRSATASTAAAARGRGLVRFGNLIDQHDKVARIEGNQDVLDDLVEEIFL